MFKKLIQKHLENYVRKYFARHPEVKLIVVAGSVGKTSTKHAVATLLSQRYRVEMDESNHNTEMSVPVALLGLKYPENVHSIFAWLAIFRAAHRRIKQPAFSDVIVQEIGADRPGDIAHFGTYIRPDIALITAVTPEHMENFKTIEAVAQEELTAANFSQSALINRDDIEGRFADFITTPNISTYGTTGLAEYRIEIENFALATGYDGKLIAPNFATSLDVNISVYGEHSLRPIMGAVAVACQLGIAPEQIVAALRTIKPVKGRMNILRGANGSTIIDDSYNSSPAAAAAALQTLYTINAPQRIAVLGDMNELGDVSAIEHQRLGALCDPNHLSWVVTVGPEAAKYLAPYAKQRGNQVKSFASALEAGSFVHSVIEDGGVVLVKGSQSGIYLEEAIKIFSHATSEDTELVRQDASWQAIKNEFFQNISS